LFLFFCSVAQNVSAVDRGFRAVTEDGTETQPYLYKNSYAFVLGNGRYTAGWEPLYGAVEDVQDVARVLQRHGFEVTIYENLDRDQFERAFTEFVLNKGQDRDNRLLFYYAGHGHTEPMATGEELGYLVMIDAPLPDTDPVGFSIKSVDMQSLITQARLIKSKHVLFLFDSCFSGSILNTRALVRKPRSMSKYAAEPVRQFITAGRANEAVPDRSYFKESFVNMLEGKEEEPVQDGVLTGEELGWFLKSKVTMYNPSQHPQYGKIRDPQLDQGDFIFILPEGPVDVEIKVRPVKKESAATPEKTTVRITPQPVQEDVKIEEVLPEPEALGPRVTASVRKKSVQDPAQMSTSKPELQEHLLCKLESTNSIDKRKAAKLLYKTYPYENDVLVAVNKELLKGYNVKIRDKYHVDAMAWLCKILGRSGQNKYMATLQEVIGRTKSGKIKRHAKKSIRSFPGFVPTDQSGTQGSLYDNL